MLRFLFSLIALALVLSPVGMSQGMAMAHGPEAVTTEGHCGDFQAPADKDKGDNAMLDCMGICSAISAGGDGSPVGSALPTAAIRAPALAALTGLHPENEPPPPRIS